MNDMILVSIDDHFIEPPDMWKNHVPQKWADDVRKRIVATKEGGDDAGLHVFTRRDGTIRHFWSGEMGFATADPGQDPRGAPDLMPLSASIRSEGPKKEGLMSHDLQQQANTTSTASSRLRVSTRAPWASSAAPAIRHLDSPPSCRSTSRATRSASSRDGVTSTA